jgi:hypothetical protein
MPGRWLIQARLWLEWRTPLLILARLSIFIHHIRAVSNITDAIAMPCKNHSRIAAAKRVPASRGGQSRSLKFSIPRAGLDKLIGTKQGQSNRKPLESQ